MLREQYGEYGYWCQGVFRTWFSFTHLCFRKATSVKKEESSKAKKSRIAISLDSGKEIMSTYWGYLILSTWKVMWRLYLHGNCDFIFFVSLCIFLIFIGLTVFINRLERVKIWIWFNFFLWFYLSSKHGGLEFHVNVKTFWILFMMNEMIKYFYVTEFDTRVFSRLCLLVTFRSENSGCLWQLSWLRGDWEEVAIARREKSLRDQVKGSIVYLF